MKSLNQVEKPFSNPVISTFPKSDARVLCNISGGRESTACLKMLLSETTNEIYAHHASFRYAGPFGVEKWQAELHAVQTIKPILEKCYRPFTYLESVIDICHRRIGSYNDIQNLLSAKVALANQCNFIVIGRKFSDFRSDQRTGGKQFRFRDSNLKVMIQQELTIAKSAEREFAQTVAFWIRVPQDYMITPCYPLYDWSDQQVREYLGDLLPHTWSCQFPVKNGDGWLSCHNRDPKIPCPSCMMNDRK